MIQQPTRELYRCLIVEDEPIFANQLSQYITQVKFLSTPIVCSSGIEALRVLATTRVDILFLDLSLPDMGGIDLLRALSSPQAVIVTSSHHEKAVDCFDLDIIDFLPKPYDFNRFLRSLSRFMQRTQPAADAKPVPVSKEEIYFKSGRRLERFSYSDILYIEAYGLYSKVFTAEGTFAVNKRISILTQELPMSRFVRIHKSYIINIDHLKRLESKQVWIRSTKLPIGITYHPVVHQKMESLGISASMN